MFEIEFGDCDERLHPHCAGVKCRTVLRVSGLASHEEAEDYARDILYDRYAVAEILESPSEGLTATSLVAAGRDPAGVILRDYNVMKTSTGQGDSDRTLVAGGHDEFSLVEPDLADVVVGVQ